MTRLMAASLLSAIPHCRLRRYQRTLVLSATLLSSDRCSPLLCCPVTDSRHEAAVCRRQGLVFRGMLSLMRHWRDEEPECRP